MTLNQHLVESVVQLGPMVHLVLVEVVASPEVEEAVAVEGAEERDSQIAYDKRSPTFVILTNNVQK